MDIKKSDVQVVKVRGERSRGRSHSFHLWLCVCVYSAFPVPLTSDPVYQQRCYLPCRCVCLCVFSVSYDDMFQWREKDGYYFVGKHDFLSTSIHPLLSTAARLIIIYYLEDNQ